ncbi:hypothetical protein [Mycobacterium spongiae]|uniref:Uncharacterized protein n=1 Tax=Mycobacterium spongiae TaxID=886343 RepID=A0A975PXZ3_9MYCO|nr:hypothetical protein [Mycobacterium spongiae]QUR68324.1 hypothetical protein F6B93_15670 [Mycobacterium spongiae]
MKVRNPRTLIAWLLGAVVTGLYVILATSCSSQMPAAPNPQIGCSGQLGPVPAPDTAVVAPSHFAI